MTDRPHAAPPVSIPWLLEGDPSVRHAALTRLLGAAPEVQEARRRGPGSARTTSTSCWNASARSAAASAASTSRSPTSTSSAASTTSETPTSRRRSSPLCRPSSTGPSPERPPRDVARTLDRHDLAAVISVRWTPQRPPDDAGELVSDSAVRAFRMTAADGPHARSAAISAWARGSASRASTARLTCMFASATSSNSGGMG